jgi:peptide/nickel transport system substrate-binding protein
MMLTSISSPISPCIARSLHLDQKTYTLKLKPGLKWQDGQSAITAEDVVVHYPNYPGRAFESPLFTNWNRVHAEKVDDLTVKFTLHEVSASFITNFAVGILPKHVWGDLSPK